MPGVLVLEDQAAVREVIAEVAEGLDMPMVLGQAASLKEARARLAEQSWDALVTDLSLGDGQSLELVAELREQGNDIPVILVSGFLTDESVQWAQRLSVAHILAKPFEPEALLKCMRAVLPAGGAAAVQRPAHKNKKLLPEIFEMDRHMGLLYRMFDEMPRYHDLPGICSSALKLAMEIIRAERGYLAIYDAQDARLNMAATQGLAQGYAASCKLDDAPFAALIRGEEELIESLPKAAQPTLCWPGVLAMHYIAVPVLQQGERVGMLCLMSWAGGRPLKSEARHLLGLLVKKLDTLLDNRATHAALESNVREALIALAHTLEERDIYTRDHSSGVSRLSVLLAREMGLDQAVVDVLRTGGLLHDIGKVGIPDAILLKPGSYTEEEYAQMKTHPEIGDSILKHMEMLKQERLIVRHHHERWDGDGYPDGLEGDAIPLIARVAGVADAIDAMMTHRVYRAATTLDYCVEQLRSGTGAQFDPAVVEAALALIGRGTIVPQPADEMPEPQGRNTPGS